MEDVKVLAFDTGGTVLDWHARFDRGVRSMGRRPRHRARLARAGERASPPLAAPDDRHGRPRFNIVTTCIATCWRIVRLNGLGGSAEVYNVQATQSTGTEP